MYDSYSRGYDNSRRRQAEDRAQAQEDEQRRYQRAYGSAVAAGEYGKAADAAGQYGDPAGVTGARTAQTEQEQRQREAMYRGAVESLAQLDAIEAAGGQGYEQYYAQAQQALQQAGPNMPAPLRQFAQTLPPTWNPQVTQYARTFTTRLRDSLLTPAQSATLEAQTAQRANQGWELDAYGRPYRLDGGVVYRNQNGQMVPDQAPVPVPRDRVPGPMTYGPEGLTADQVRAEREFSRDWRGVYNNFAEIRDSWQRIQTSAAQGNSAGDLALVVGFTKLLDPGSVAREGEVALTQSAASMLAQAQNFLPRLQQGNTLLPPEVRRQLLNVAREMYANYDRAYQRLAEDYASTADNYGFDRERVMMGYSGPSQSTADGGSGESDKTDKDARVADLQRQIQALDAAIAAQSGGQ